VVVVFAIVPGTESRWVTIPYCTRVMGSISAQFLDTHHVVDKRTESLLSIVCASQKADDSYG
jgi:hypothetical protein